jgi:hypothetical protein
LAQELGAHLAELTDRVIREAIDDDVSEAPDAERARLEPGQPGNEGVGVDAGRTDGSPT